jgi:hypothetical protein
LGQAAAFVHCPAANIFQGSFKCAGFAPMNGLSQDKAVSSLEELAGNNGVPPLE